MASYRFRYTNAAGAVVRASFVQCHSDNQAIARARDTMQDTYAALEICEGERTVFNGQAASRAETA